MCNLTFSAQANSPFYSHAKDVIIIRKILKSSSLVTQRKKHVTLTLILRNRIYLVTIDHYGGSKSKETSWRPFASLIAASVTAHILSDAIIFQDWPHFQGTSKY